MPILFLMFDTPKFPESVAMHVAATTSLASIIPPSIAMRAARLRMAFAAFLGVRAVRMPWNAWA